MTSMQDIRGDWNQLSGAVKANYGQITDDELSQTEGNSQKLIGLIQEKSGQTREQVEAFVHEISDRMHAGYEYSTRTVSQRPAESVFAAFAVGMIAGLAIGVSLANQRHPDPSWYRWRS